MFIKVEILFIFYLRKYAIFIQDNIKHVRIVQAGPKTVMMKQKIWPHRDSASRGNCTESGQMSEKGKGQEEEP